jgi:hypothetical protein
MIIPSVETLAGRIAGIMRPPLADIDLAQRGERSSPGNAAGRDPPGWSESDFAVFQIEYQPKV